MEFKIEHKGISNPRPEESEKKNFDPETSIFKESENTVKGFEGRQFTLLGNNGELIGDLLLTRDAPDDSWIKIRVFGVEKPYMGSGAVNYMYDKSFEVAKENNKDLVMDDSVSIPAYKSFIKYLKDHNYKYEENILNEFEEITQKYVAPNHTYTIIVNNKYFI